MFEKDAEEYANGKGHEHYNYLFEENAGSPADFARCCFKDGAEFGYNKANEWHYVKDGDLPKDNTQVLVLLENKRMKISIFMEKKFTVWNKDYNTYTKLYNVIAWKEIVLPELPKEIEIRSDIFPEITLPEESAEFVDKIISDAEKRLKESE